MFWSVFQVVLRYNSKITRKGHGLVKTSISAMSELKFSQKNIALVVILTKKHSHISLRHSISRDSDHRPSAQVPQT